MRRRFITFCILAILVFTLGFYMLLQLKATRNIIKTSIEKIVSSEKNLNFEIAELNGNLINRLELKGVNITVANEKFIKVNKISTNYSLPLLVSLLARGDIPLRNTSIDGMKVSIIRDKNGIWNYDKIGDKKEKGIDTKDTISIFLRNNIIRNSSLEIIDKEKDEFAEFNILDESLFSVNLIGINKKFEIEIGDLSFDYYPHDIRVRNLKTDLILAGPNCVFKNTKFKINDISIIGQGIINNFDAPEFNFSAYFDDLGQKDFGKFNAYIKSNGKMHSLENIEASMELSMINSYIKEKRIWTNLEPIKINGTNAEIKGFVNTEFGNSYISGDFDFKRLITGKGRNKVDFNINVNDVITDEIIEIFNYTSHTIKVGKESKLDSDLKVVGYWEEKSHDINITSEELLISDKNVGNFNLNGNARFLKDKIDLNIKSKVENLKVTSVLQDIEIDNDRIIKIDNNMFGDINLIGQIPTSDNLLVKSNLTFNSNLKAIDQKGNVEISSSSKGVIQEGKVFIENIDINSDFLKLSVKSDGVLSDGVNCKYELYSKDISILSKLSNLLNFSGSINSSGTIVGDVLNPKIDLSGEMGNFSYGKDFFAESLKFEAKSFTDLKSLKMKIKSQAKNAVLLGKDIDFINFESKSVNQNLVSSVYFENGKTRILNSSLTIKDIDKPHKTIEIKDVEILTDQKLLKNVGNILFNISPERVELVKSKFTYDNGYIKAKGTIINQDNLNIFVDLKDIDQKLISELLNYRESLFGKVSGKINLGGTIEKPDFNIKLNSKNLAYSNFNTDDLNISLIGKDNKLDIDIKSGTKSSNKLNLSGTLESNLNLRELNTNLQQATINLKLYSKNYNIGFLKIFNGNINNIDGSLNSDLKISGSFSKPYIKGKAKIRNINVRLVQLLNELYISNLDASFSNNILKIPKTVLTSEKGSSTFSGYLDLKDFTYKGKADLDKLFVHLPAMKANISGNINFEGEELKTKVDGDIKLAKGQIFLSPEKVKNIKDVRFVEYEYRNEFTITQDKQADFYTENVQLEMDVAIPEGTWIRSKGINTEVVGNLKIVKEFEQDNIIKGSIDTLGGHYIIFGKLFKIDEGTINFPGTSVLDPQLNVSASYKISEISVNINVQGTANEPNLSLSSDPVFEETDIISYLVFGTSSDNLGTEERIFAGEFATNFAAGEISDLIGSKFGIDVLTIQGHEEGGLSNPQIQVGSYVTENIYIGYERSTSFTKEDSSTFMTDKFRFEWKFNDKFSMESEVGGENSGADLFYNKDF